MIAVSDSFKKAIKSDNREIHGYVDVVYDKQEGDYSVTQIPTISPLSKQDGSDLMDDIKVMKNYATLENNYFLLDGSFILANTNTLESSGGYISEDIFSDISDNTITLVSSETGYVTTKGLTIFFKDNIPFDFDIVITTEYGEEEDETIKLEIRNNTAHNYQKIFENNTTIKKLDLIIYTTEYNDRRIRIPDITLSLANVYEGEELVSFEVNEELDIMMNGTPINTCNINLNNYPDENGYYIFDPINPAGIVPYLTNNTIVTPYIGVLTEDEGIVYIKMGKFYLTNWDANTDGNVTLNCSDIIYFFKDESIRAIDSSETGNNVATIDVNDYDYNLSLLSNALACYEIRSTNLYEYLHAHLYKICGFYNSDDYDYIYTIRTNRDDNIRQYVFKPASVVEKLYRSELINDPNITINNDIYSVKLKHCPLYAISTGTTTRKETLNTNYVLTKTEEYIWFSLSQYTEIDNSNSFSYNVISGTANATIIAHGNFMIYVRLRGTVGSSITLHYTGIIPPYDVTDVELIYNGNNTNGDSISVDTINYNSLPFPKLTAAYLLNHKYKYKVNVDTIGDPSITTGDLVEIETRYTDNQDIIITKQKFTYDGALSCELEGMGN